jgi:hypothetical protein
LDTSASEAGTARRKRTTGSRHACRRNCCGPSRSPLPGCPAGWRITSSGIADIARLAWNGAWKVAEEMNGDQSDQGRGLLMDAHAIHWYRVRLYDYPRR